MYLKVSKIFLLKILIFFSISHARENSCTAIIEETIITGKCKGALKHGKFVGYYKNGLLEWEVHYKNNILHGKFKHFYPNGTLHFSGSYKNGKLHGNFKQNNHKDELLQTTFQHGALHNWIYIISNGQKLHGLKFYYGKLIQYMYFD